MVFLVPKDGGGHEDTAGSGIALEFDDVDDASLTLEIEGLEDHASTFAFTESGGLTGTAQLDDHLTAETHTVRITAKDGGDSDGSNPLSVLDELTVYIGLNASKDTGLEVETDYTFTGSDVADDNVYARWVDKFGMEESKITLDLGHGTNTFVNNFPPRKLPTEGGNLDYIGGDGDDTLTMYSYTTSKGTTKINLGNGTNTVTMGDYAGSHGGTMEIKGGTGVDSISLRGFAGYETGGLEVYLGADSSADEVLLLGHVAASGTGSSVTKAGQVEIHDFDPLEDKIQFKFMNGAIVGLTKALVEGDFKPLVLDDADSDGAADDILVETIDGLGADKPPVKFYIVGNYTNTDDFTFTVDGSDLILA